MEFDVLYTRVNHHLATGREAEAINMLQDNLNDYQQVAEFWMLYSACHLSLEQWDDAEATARAALGLKPEHPVAGEQLAMALANLHRRDEALATIRQVITVEPEYARGHYLLGMILLGNIRNNDERNLASQATEHALKLEPENPDFYHGAAVAADVAQDQRGALGFLEAGLKIDPHHQGLLRAAGSIKNGHKVVGDQGQLLRGMLATDPMNEKLHEDYAENFVAKQAVYSDRWWLFIPVLAAISVFGHGSGGLTKAIIIAVLVVVSGLFAWWNITTYQKTKKSLPAGYLNDIHARFRTLPTAKYGYQISWLTAVAGGVLACFSPLWGAVLMLLGVAAGRLAAALISREIAAPPSDRQNGEERRVHLLVLSGSYAAGFWKRVMLLILQLVAFGICVANESQLAAVPLGSVGLGLLVVGSVLAYCQFKLGFKNNAFAYGQTVSSSAKGRNFALLRGNLGGMYFIGLHLLFGVIAFFASVALVIGSPQAMDNSDSSQDDQSGSVEQPSQQPPMPTELPTTKPDNFTFSPMPELPEVPSVDQ